MNRNNAASSGNGPGSNSAARPVQSIRFGQLEAAIWRNETENGIFYNVTLKRHFTNDSGSWGESQSFGWDDLPTVAKLVNDCHSAIHRMRIRDTEGGVEACAQGVGALAADEGVGVVAGGQFGDADVDAGAGEDGEGAGGGFDAGGIGVEARGRVACAAGGARGARGPHQRRAEHRLARGALRRNGARASLGIPRARDCLRAFFCR